MSRIFPGLVLASPALLLGVLAGAATAADTSLTNFSSTQFQTPTAGTESLTTLPTSTTLVAQNRRSNLSVPSVAELEAGRAATTSSMGQVTSVSQLSDVRPTDWAYQALASLVEKYGCIAGYPDGTFRGNRAATRYEMAAALNACLDVISDRFATKEDLETLRRLMQEFANELAVIKGRVTNLEGRVANLEATQFATLTKLNATVIFNVSDILTNKQALRPGAPGPQPVQDTNPVANSRVRLNLDTSFYGKDRLRLRLQAANITSYAGLMGTNMGRLGYDGNNNNQFELQKAFYSFPVTRRGQMILDFVGGEFNDNVNNFNPFLQSSDTGALSRFGRYHPIYRAGSAANAAGVTFKYDLIQNKERGTGVTLNVGYLAPFANDPNPGTNTGLNGFFDGAYAALAQVDVRPIKNLALGVTYTHSYGLDPFLGTGSSGFRSAADPLTDAGSSNVPNQAADAVGFQFTYRPIKQLNVAGWAGYANVYGVRGAALTGGRREAEIVNWAITFASPDLWRKGDLLGLVFGQPPQLISITNVPSALGDGSYTRFNSYHLEGFYRFAVSRNISITPGVIAIFNPNSNSNNDPIVVGAVRTTFSF
ncbi:iron uptake porin [Thermosynechococcus sp. JY1334]|uniref:iron uptake porin n=1 Tax=unclassified Thermosynechococcus TaxID=2622553 RepID=UPI002672EA7C|nr:MULTISPECIES: iron uptake porin [unclassified Thermosynechococcus]MDR7897721.1 iron uptake porin [Thermosynechococcus sp. JY1332]MDR7905119.1 iron uptake porin [Thermosynechococcus sp. JY1334]WKT87338.1 iron uptake porin [Thermosynechococcus sp. JY1339]WNC56280.1 iron uptake porin [Thermosynechococcus sp. JY1331]